MKPNIPKKQSGTGVVDVRFPIKLPRSAKNGIQASAVLPTVEQNILGLPAAGK